MDCIGIHTAYMSKRVMSLVFKVVRNALHRYTHCIHVGTCDVTRVQSGTEWIASVYTAYMSERVMSLVFKVVRNGLHRYTLHTCRNV